ncbi:hypothetical protein CISG_03658 [Coccidioides immitis RMSCC 3703]|uniref:Uncharacterized protein n=2 Tax=Coccidioides immitis TaxID=5501 RepID=A0A0J8QM97_COCIT|nr:hypothetical protein CIRG_04079 [Coccidioides immitis RMSCC 2394]KMU73525.1 hypothetical protein CISG_03658 [Coccidioides immitis RMSCC 3703]
MWHKFGRALAGYLMPWHACPHLETSETKLKELGVKARDATSEQTSIRRRGFAAIARGENPVVFSASLVPRSMNNRSPVLDGKKKNHATFKSPFPCVDQPSNCWDLECCTKTIQETRPA